MNIYGHMRVAEEMELSKGFVIQAQKRYLKDCIKCVDFDIEDALDWVDGYFDINEVYALHSLDRLCREKAKLKKDYDRVVSILKPSTGDVTDEMIQTAKEYHVDKLIEFNHGKAIAFCHEDRHPSMFHATRNNTANCPVCDKCYNAIDILIYRDGYSFIDAVRRLG